MDSKTGIHEPMVIIPWWLDCRKSRWLPYRAVVRQVDMHGADYNRMRIDELTSNKR